MKAPAMQRRNFLAASAAGATIAALPHAARAQAADDKRQYLEWRTYRLPGTEKHALIDDYLQQAAIPAWGRMGLSPVGVFKEIAGSGGLAPTASLQLLLIYPTLDAFGEGREALERDPEYRAAAADYLAAAKDDAAYQRIDSWLMISFEGMPAPAAPAAKPRVFELRTYESHSEERARAKIDMFNSGEIPIFRACGFETVFFGEGLVGAGLPHLKYMLAAPDMAANEAGWQKFVAHPDWLAMRDLPEYKDTVSNIQKLYLEPTPYSQI
jgi:hypothetical protein